MRELVHEALAGARDILGEVVSDIRQENKLSDDEVLVRYARIRGDPLAILDYTAQRVGPGADLLAEARRYEQRMERLWRQRGGRR